MDAPLRASRFAQRLSPDEAMQLIGPVLAAPREGEDVVLAPPLGGGAWPDASADSQNPFIRYRRQLWSYEVALRLGRSDQDYVQLVADLDEAVAAVDGAGFRVTPLTREDGLGDSIEGFAGELLVKDETNNVSGSHKGRHLFGLALHLEILHRTGTAALHGVQLAIASCGNAALAAAVVAKAIGQPLQVFVPTNAAESVLERLTHLEAEIVVCERRRGEAGDPAYLRFLEVLKNGSIPFGCQGPVNGLTLDGGRTIGFELAEQLGAAGADRIFVQVGGGALATGVSDGLAAGFEAGVLGVEPRLHAVQAEGAHPLSHAYRLLFGAGEGPEPTGPLELDAVAAQERISDAATTRSHYMQPWPQLPSSAAEGILDDETYDWQSVLRATVATEGWPLVAQETEVLLANELATVTGINADHTGTAGLAGLLRWIDSTKNREPDERVVLLFTGVRR